MYSIGDWERGNNKINTERMEPDSKVKMEDTIASTGITEKKPTPEMPKTPTDETKTPRKPKDGRKKRKKDGPDANPSATPAPTQSAVPAAEQAPPDPKVSRQTI